MAKKLTSNNRGEITYVYSFENTSTFGFSYKLPSKKPDSFEISYNIETDITTNIPAEFINVRLKFKGTLVGISDGTTINEDVIFADTYFTFKLVNLKEYIIHEDETDMFNEMHQPLLATLIGIGISTSRGILIEKLKGTLYHSKMLPIINPNTFFKKI